MLTKKEQIEEFLRESNEIEGVYDIDSLKQAVIAWDWLIKQKKMTTKVVLKTHKLLMENQIINAKYKGNFRDCEVRIGYRYGMRHEDVPYAIEEWAEKMNNKDNDWKDLHIAYEHIHPFVDGNGRTGRMFMNWFRIKKLNIPLLNIKNAEKEDYYEWF